VKQPQIAISMHMSTTAQSSFLHGDKAGAALLQPDGVRRPIAGGSVIPSSHASIKSGPPTQTAHADADALI
jgi:hypothetical protein